jgi:eukaryotic-like serine/threonine-protein kinase
MTLAPGTRIGPYEVLSMVGAGGMGEVYRAQDTRLGRLVAIKFTRSDMADATEATALFEREGRAIAALSHPRICSVHDVGSFGSQNYLVMECLDGETLEHRLGRGRLPLDELFRVAIAVAEGLVAAHRAGIVHRDLKPANVMLTRDGPKLLDFGIAKQTVVAAVAKENESDTVTAASTVTGRIVGTIPYMAPEQLEGARTDSRTDVFAFGAMLFEMATGQRAFGGASAASQMAAILADTRPVASGRRPEIPRSLDRIISTCLARDPDDRWQHATDLLRELQWAAADECRNAWDEREDCAQILGGRVDRGLRAAGTSLEVGQRPRAATEPATRHRPPRLTPAGARVRHANHRGGRHECR